MLSTVFLFLNIGTGEMVLIVFAALMLFGGEKLPGMARTLGKGIRDFKDASEDVKREINNQINNYSDKKEETTTTPVIEEHTTPVIEEHKTALIEEHTADQTTVAESVEQHPEPVIAESVAQHPKPVVAENSLPHSIPVSNPFVSNDEAESTGSKIDLSKHS